MTMPYGLNRSEIIIRTNDLVDQLDPTSELRAAIHKASTTFFVANDDFEEQLVHKAHITLVNNEIEQKKSNFNLLNKN